MLNLEAKKYIETILTNDETSTDAELIELFMKELNLCYFDAKHTVDKRDYYLNNL